MCNVNVLVTHAIYIIIVFAAIVQSYIMHYIQDCHMQKGNGTRRCSAVRRHCFIKSPVA